jgi:hypothetical protein
MGEFCCKGWFAKISILSKTHLSLSRFELPCRDPDPLREEAFWCHYLNRIFSEHIFCNWDGTFHGKLEAQMFAMAPGT